MEMGTPPEGSWDDGQMMMMMMRSHFYWGDKVQLLFSGWATQTPGGYILTLSAVFILALFHQWFGELEKGLLHLPSSPSSPSASSSSSSSSSSSHHVANNKPSQSKLVKSLKTFATALMRHRITRLFLLTAIHVLTIASGYLLMLIVMSFNVGVFLSVLAGLSFGFILFQI